jgi:hypothetical protein
MSLDNNFEYRIQKYRKYKNINIHDKHIAVLYYTDTNEFSCIVSYLYINSFTDEVEYICSGSNILSRDGSYMSNFLKIEDLKIIPSDYIKKTQIYLNKFKDNLKLELVYVDKNITVKKEIKTNKIFIFSIYCIISYYNNTVDRLEELSNIKKKWIDVCGKLSLEMINSINSVSNIFGQKISPDGYYYKEGNIIKYRDFSEEIKINYIMTKETFNKRTPSYSILMEYLSLENVTNSIWDNETIKNKLVNSKILKNHYKKNNIQIIVNEYCGDTILKYFQSNKLKENLILGDLKNNNIDLKCFIFQILYSISILYEKGYIHGDLHINNISVRKSYKTFFIKNKKNNKGIEHSIFSLDKNEYKINFYGGYATILDFGRVIKLKNLENHKEYFYKKIESAVGIKLNSAFCKDNFIKCCIVMDIYKFIESLYYLINTEGYKTEADANKFKKSIEKFIKKIIKGKYSDVKNEKIIINFINESEYFYELLLDKNDKITCVDNFKY